MFTPGQHHPNPQQREEFALRQLKQARADSRQDQTKITTVQLSKSTISAGISLAIGLLLLAILLLRV